MDRSILILGGNGTIGSRLRRSLDAKGWRVWSTSRQPQSALPDGWGHWDATIEEADAGLPDAGLVVCAFGIGSLRQCEEDPLQSSLVNVDAPERIAQLFVERRSRVVLLSTNLVLGGDVSYPDETSRPDPLCEYARQKAVAERRVLDLGGVVIRLTKHLESVRGLLEGWARQLRSGKPIEAFADRRVSLVDQARVEQAVQGIVERDFRGVLHLSGEKDLSYVELAHWVAEAAGVSTDQVRPVSAKARLKPLNERFQWERNESLGMARSANALGLTAMPLTESRATIETWIRDLS